MGAEVNRKRAPRRRLRRSRRSQLKASSSPRVTPTSPKSTESELLAAGYAEIAEVPQDAGAPHAQVRFAEAVHRSGAAPQDAGASCLIVQFCASRHLFLGSLVVFSSVLLYD